MKKPSFRIFKEPGMVFVSGVCTTKRSLMRCNINTDSSDVRLGFCRVTPIAFFTKTSFFC